MDFGFITEFLEDFDISKLLPDLNGMLGKLDLLLRILVMLTPLVVLGLGLMYFLVPPKEANHSFGYRFYWGMSSVESWRFTQKLAGIVWSVLGFVMLVIMAVLCSSFHGMEAMPMVEKAVKMILWELALVAVSCVAIDITVMVFFDSKGVRRNFRKGAGQPVRRRPAEKEDGYEDEAYDDEYDEEYDDEYDEECDEEYDEEYEEENFREK